MKGTGNLVVAAVIGVAILVIIIFVSAGFFQSPHNNVINVDQASRQISLCRKVELFFDCDVELTQNDPGIVEECKEIFIIDELEKGREGEICIEDCKKLEYCKQFIEPS